MVCKELGKVKEEGVEEVLKKSLPRLDDLYNRMIEQIRGYVSIDLYIRILATVSIVFCLVTLEELPVLVKGLKRYSNNLRKLGQIISSCRSFLALQDHRVYFMHQSAKDFLLGPAVDIILSSRIRDVHCDIFSRSLKAFLGEGDGLQGSKRNRT